MCYNCGCQNPDDDMGDPKNITNQTFSQLAKSRGKSSEEVKKEVLNYLEVGKGDNPEFEEMFSSAAKVWGQSVVDAKKETKKTLARELA